MSTRRGFLLKALTAGGAAAVGGVGQGCVRWIDAAPVVDVPAPVNGTLSLEISRYPDLAEAGSAITIRPEGEEPILVVHWPDGRHGALASVCTHQGCPLGFADGAVECPCHGARFGFDGEVLNPPATQGLKRYEATLDQTSGNLVIQLLAGTPGFPSVQNAKVFFSFAQFPELKNPGGSVSGTPVGLSRPLVVVALSGGSYAALDATCTHLRCTVGYAAASNNLVCPCHGSTFGLDGTVSKPPASKPLRSYPASSDATGVTVTLG